MKTKKSIKKAIASLFTIAFLFLAFTTNAQTKQKSTSIKDCCMMMDGKMMTMKNGKMMPMEKDMKMNNGTTCMTTGECKMKDGKMMKMKDGDCMDMSGKMCSDNMKTMMKNKAAKEAAMAYACPMHSEFKNTQPSKCPQCGMDMVKQ